MQKMVEKEIEKDPDDKKVGTSREEDNGQTAMEVKWRDKQTDKNMLRRYCRQKDRGKHRKTDRKKRTERQTQTSYDHRYKNSRN